MLCSALLCSPVKPGQNEVVGAVLARLAPHGEYNVALSCGRLGLLT